MTLKVPMSDAMTTRLTSAKILVVDDEEMNLRLIRRILERHGYLDVKTTSDGKEVQHLVREYNPDLLLLDLHMPAPDGFDILRSLEDEVQGGHLPVLVLTGDSTPESKRGALALGARDFISKPFDAAEALLRIRNLLETRFLHRVLEDQNILLQAHVQERTHELQQSQFEIIDRLARAAEIRDDDTGRHTQRVGELAANIAAALGMREKDVDTIRRAAPLHDVGKIGIPDAILHKPNNLSKDEIEVIRTHTVIGGRILSGGQSELMRMAERIALGHHEWWDGNGYPHGRSGCDIPIEARVVAVADCLDALTHTRPYRGPWPLDEAVAEIEREAGTHFDREIVHALVSSGCYRTVVVSPPTPARAIA